MGSPTKKHKTRKALKAASAGKTRKNDVKNAGSTKPGLPLNVPNANEKKQAERKAKATARV